eukprot:COSAG01_NODE_3324_length_6254_cov_10.119090_1_plen_45_part_10
MKMLTLAPTVNPAAADSFLLPLTNLASGGGGSHHAVISRVQVEAV